MSARSLAGEPPLGLVEPVVLHGSPSQDSDSPATLTRVELVGGSGHAAALVDDLRTRRSDAKLSHLARESHGGRRGSIGPGDSVGAIRLGQGQDGWAGATETGSQGTGAARGGDQDLQMREESRPVGLVQAVMHAGRYQASVAGV